MSEAALAPECCLPLRRKAFEELLPLRAAFETRAPRKPWVDRKMVRIRIRPSPAAVPFGCMLLADKRRFGYRLTRREGPGINCINRPYREQP